MDSSGRVFIYGAGDLGREILGWIRAENLCASQEIEFAGFIDDRGSESAQKEIPILTLEEASVAFPGSSVIIAVSSPSSRKEMARKLYLSGMKPYTYVHSSVIFGSDASLGEGTVVSPRSIICSSAQIGRFCVINCACTVGHDTELKDFVTLLGSNVINGGVYLGEGCLIGSGAVIHPRIKIGEQSIVGIGSIVLKNVRAGTTVFGNPARTISS